MLGRMLQIWRCVALVAALATTVAAGCERRAGSGAGGAGAAGSRGEGPLVVVATTAQIADLARGAAGAELGESLTVEAIMGEGVDPHTYKLTRSDAIKLDGADVILASGLHLEGRLVDTLSQLKASGKRVVLVADQLPPEELIAAGTSGEAAKAHDPHFWMDTKLFALASGVVASTLSEAMPTHSETFAMGAKAYRERLSGLDRYAEGVLGAIPPKQRVLVTSHDAFAYLGRRFGLEVHAIQGISTESEASVRDIESLAKLLAERNIPAVFIESSVPRRTIEGLISATRARGHSVVIGGELFSDAMGPPGTYEGTYIGMMDHNLTTIARGLGASSPPPSRGMSGLLRESKEPAK